MRLGIDFVPVVGVFWCTPVLRSFLFSTQLLLFFFFRFGELKNKDMKLLCIHVHVFFGFTNQVLLLSVISKQLPTCC